LLNVGIISVDSALNFSLSGPLLRSVGIKWDLRKNACYESYRKLKFKVPYSLNGDCYDRYLLRIEELRQSNSLILQVLNNMPKGKIKVENYKIVPPLRFQAKSLMESLIHHFKIFSNGIFVNKGEAYVGVEAPKGEFGVYLVSNNSGIPYRCKIRAPGFTHLQTINYISKGHLIADVVTIIGTLDIVFGEIDR
jgi:NADH:ubiquinone oxidoreductase subunit D